jgi:hypothetical protein
MPALWRAASTTAKDRKRLLRTLIADVTLVPEPDQGKARIGIRWHTGATDEIVTRRGPRSYNVPHRTPPEIIDLVRQADPAMRLGALADALNTAGHRTGRGRPFTAKAVEGIRYTYGVPSAGPYAPGEVSVSDVAARLSVSIGVVYHWIETKQLVAHRSRGNRLCIPGLTPSKRPAASESPTPTSSNQ